MPKTIMQILDDWDDYKDRNINIDKDWSEKHDNYLKEKFYSESEVKKIKDDEFAYGWMEGIKSAIEFDKNPLTEEELKKILK